MKINHIAIFPVLFLLFCRDTPGNEYLFSFEVMNGERFSDFCTRIEKTGMTDCESFSKIASSENFENFPFLPEKNNVIRFEGLFRPGKYKISLREEVSECAANAASKNDSCVRVKYNFAKDILIHLLEAGAGRYPGSSPVKFYEDITLASIIEKEAASNRDYRLVSSVFHNRLNKNMPLGSCPTVEYALGFHRPFLLNKDVAVESPYNVYRRKGLPPSPIAFFSDEALEASRNPETTGYIFFVFDWTTGDLHFSEKYEQHQMFAKQARENFINKFGIDALHKMHREKFYEL